MRNKIAVLLLLMAVFALSACGREASAQTESSPEKAPASTDAEKEPTPQAFSFSAKGVTLSPGAEASLILEKLGKETKLFEAPSCAFESMDRIYYYPGFSLTTYSDGGPERILSIALSDDSVETEQGVYLGMSEQDVTAVYGAGEQSADKTVLSYYSGDSELRIFFDGGRAKDITFYYLPVQTLYEKE